MLAKLHIWGNKPNFRWCCCGSHPAGSAATKTAEDTGEPVTATHDTFGHTKPWERSHSGRARRNLSSRRDVVCLVAPEPRGSAAILGSSPLDVCRRAQRIAVSWRVVCAPASCIAVAMEGIPVAAVLGVVASVAFFVVGFSVQDCGGQMGADSLKSLEAVGLTRRRLARSSRSVGLTRGTIGFPELLWVRCFIVFFRLAFLVWVKCRTL